MKDSWRIGIDEENETDLITKGLFRYSRNPIFLGVILSNLGLFLIIPNMGTLLVLTLSYFSIQIQIRLEEDFLKKQFGTDYLIYCKSVRRWI
jgi:protein-S-isoprenylcysteine O-methyltransferase Ste14